MPSNVLPFDASLLFVLDDTISSKGSSKGDLVRVHLKSAIVLNGREVVPAGTPATIRIVNASKADILDTYGFVDIFFEPLQLPDGRTLPLRAPTSRLAVNVSGGHESTVGVEDQIGDIFIPDYALYQIFRHGKNFVLSPGDAIRARTEAKLEALPNGTLAIETPPPVTNHSSCRIRVSRRNQPRLHTARSEYRHRTRPTPTPSPTPSPSDDTSRRYPRRLHRPHPRHEA